jgi:uncharacterized protein YfiM (DUF2279 family)
MKKPPRLVANASANRRAAVRTGAPAGRLATGARLLAGAVLAAGALASPSAFAQSDSWTGQDKLKHFGVSAPMGLLGATFAGPNASTYERVLYGALIGSLPGVFKELTDLRTPGSSPSLKDMSFNIAGAAIGALMGDSCCMIRPYTTRADKIDGIAIDFKISF